MVKKEKKKVDKKTADAIKEIGERMARRKLLEELFYDFYCSRGHVYWVNFVRGLFFGLGTIIGGTVIVALFIWLLGQIAGWFPGIGDYVMKLIKTINR